ncbi:MAG: ribosomal L7Ae/L30e/S12e/Gadd45 family protein [Clostridiales bacterium]|nr:ribosomal L7Ae/L30e/S12e/Gadd45 family protein [Clostridiales bacterium]
MALDQKIAGLVGFAAKSGKLLLGTYSVEQGIRQKRAKLVLAAEDINPKRLKILRQWCGDMDIPILAVGKKEDYGALLRKPPLGLLALTEEQMVKGIITAAKTNGGD